MSTTRPPGSPSSSSPKPTPLRVRVSYVRSLGVMTDMDLTKANLPPVEGILLAPPTVGASLIVWRGAKAAITTSPIEHVAEGGGRTWEVRTQHTVYRVRVVGG